MECISVMINDQGKYRCVILKMTGEFICTTTNLVGYTSPTRAERVAFIEFCKWFGRVPSEDAKATLYTHYLEVGDKVFEPRVYESEQEWLKEDATIKILDHLAYNDGIIKIRRIKDQLKTPYLE